jgi:hypothetical protein
VTAPIRVSTIGEQGQPRSRRRLDEQGRLELQHVIAINRVGNLINQGIRAMNETALNAPEARSYTLLRRASGGHGAGTRGHAEMSAQDRNVTLRPK